MSKTYITFGSAHIANARREGIPASQHGWIEIIGVREDQARGIIHGLLGDQWSFSYDETSWNEKDPELTKLWYPEGCTARITIDMDPRSTDQVLTALEDAEAEYAAVTDEGDHETVEDYETLEDARLEFANHAYGILARLTGRAE